MTIFYHGPLARITQEVFEARNPLCESFPIRELRSIHIVQPDAGPSRIGLLWPRAAAVVLAVVAITIAYVTWQPVSPSEVTVAVILATIVSSLVAAGCWRAPEQAYELRAVFRGKSVCLLRTFDQRLLGQVSRGLVRALERNA